MTPANSERERLMTAEELAERWQFKKEHVYRLAREGKIPVAPLPGKYVRFRRDQIERYELGEWTPPDESSSSTKSDPNGRSARAALPTTKRRAAA